MKGLKGCAIESWVVNLILKIPAGSVVNARQVGPQIQ